MAVTVQDVAVILIANAAFVWAMFGLNHKDSGLSLTLCFSVVYIAGLCLDLIAWPTSLGGLVWGLGAAAATVVVLIACVTGMCTALFAAAIVRSLASRT